MRVIRFIDDDGEERWGVPRDDGTAAMIEDACGLLAGRPNVPGGCSVREMLRSGRALAAMSRTARVETLLAPAVPVNILCAGRNYRAGDQDGGSASDSLSTPAPLELFMKPTSAIQHPGQPIVLPRYGEGAGDVDAEGELAVLIGTALRNVNEQDALAAIFGFTIAVDVTDRRWQTPTGPPLWMRGKGFDTFCPLGPVLVTADELHDRLTGPDGLAIGTVITGEVVRDGSTRQMIRSVAALISEISRSMTILPGTLLLTGAPRLVPAVGESRRGLREGDVVEVTIAGIGRLTNPVQQH